MRINPEVEALLEGIRLATRQHGADWLQEQLGSLLSSSGKADHGDRQPVRETSQTQSLSPEAGGHVCRCRSRSPELVRGWKTAQGRQKSQSGVLEATGSKEDGDEAVTAGLQVCEDAVRWEQSSSRFIMEDDQRDWRSCGHREALEEGGIADQAGRRSAITPGSHERSAEETSNPAGQRLERQASDRVEWHGTTAESSITEEVMVPGSAPTLHAAGSTGGLVAWIVGNSYVFWAKRRAAVRDRGEQLGFPEAQIKLKWFGFRGFGWKDVIGEVFHLLDRGNAPNVLLLHAGGNDLGLIPQKELVRQISQDLRKLKDRLPGVIVVWSEIVPRLNWRHARDHEAVARCRGKVNKLVASFTKKMHGVVVRHQELEKLLPGYFQSDGVHLTDIGIDILIFGFQEGIERALSLWGSGGQLAKGFKG
ncbi:uncharacterized protein LOC128468000 [Spea bombifrons]|uniref:uncharacterized protein LOC128468000 n=1 Tax=Spea bombifrons TaxID=233779 RepID=UPI002349DD2C|nr:uncharacterized protein LOC128468000 [Spea bombifrons]